MRGTNPKQNEPSFSQSAASWLGWLTWKNAPKVATYFLCSIGGYFVFKEMSSLFSRTAPQDDISFELGSSTRLDIVREIVEPPFNAQTSSPAARHLLSNPDVVNPIPNIKMTEGRDPVTRILNATHIFGSSVDPALTVQTVGGGPLPPFITTESSSLNPSASLPNPANDPFDSGNFVAVYDGTAVYALDLTNPLVPVVGATFFNIYSVTGVAVWGSDIGLTEANVDNNSGFVRIGPLLSPGLIRRVNVPTSLGSLSGLMLRGDIVWVITDGGAVYRYDISGAICSTSSLCPAMKLGYFSGGIILDTDLEPVSGDIWIVSDGRITRVNEAAVFGGDYTPPGALPVAVKVTETSDTVKPLQVATGDRYLELADDTGGGGISLIGSVMLPPSAGTPIDLTMAQDYAAIACTNEMVVIDRTNRASPSIAAKIPMTTPQGIAAAGTSVMLTRGASGIEVYDFSKGFTTNVTVAAGVGDQGHYELEAVALESGTSQNRTAFFNATVIPETAPTVANPIPKQVLLAGSAQVLAFPNPFTDVNGDKVTVTSITQASGNNLLLFANPQQGETQQFLATPTEAGDTVFAITGTDDSPYQLNTTTTALVSAGYKPEKNPVIALAAEFDIRGGLQSHEFPSNVLLVDGKPDPTMLYEVLSTESWLSAEGLKLSFDPTKLSPNATTAAASVVIRGTTTLPLTGETEPFLVTAKEKAIVPEKLESIRPAVDKLTADVGVKFERTLDIVPGSVRIDPVGAKVTITLDADAPGWVSLAVVDTGNAQKATLSGTAPRSEADIFGPLRQGQRSFSIKVKVISTGATERVKVDIGVTGTSYYMIALYVLLLLRFGPLIVRRLGSFMYNRWKQRTPPENIHQLTTYRLDKPVTEVEAFDYEEIEGRWRSCLFTGRTRRAAGLPEGVSVIPSSDGKGIIGIRRSGVADLEELGSRIRALEQQRINGGGLNDEKEEQLERLKLQHADKIAELDHNFSQATHRSTSYVFSRERGIRPFRCKLIHHEILEPGNPEQQTLLPIPTDGGQNNPIFDVSNDPENTAIEMDDMEEASAGVYTTDLGFFSPSPKQAANVSMPENSEYGSAAALV